MSINPRLYHDRPMLVALAIDASGSMSDCVEDLVEAHQGLISVLRASEKCELGVLSVYQTRFAEDVRVLNSWSVLDPNGDDSVVLLTAANYQPCGQTAQYLAVYSLLRELCAELEIVRQSGFLPSAKVVVITNCHDTDSGAEQIIRDEFQKLIDREWLQSSVLIGLARSRFSSDTLDDTRNRMGFGKSVLVTPGKAAREIRRAFMPHAVPAFALRSP